VVRPSLPGADRSAAMAAWQDVLSRSLAAGGAP
jgi:hypothetical protein